MSLRLPQELGSPFSADRVHDSINHEILAEKAAPLGRAGKRLAAKLAELSGASAGSDRDLLIREAADAAHSYMIQRELCGLLSQQSPFGDYAVPKEVVARIGAS